jgi:hypothetical protein
MPKKAQKIPNAIHIIGMNGIRIIVIPEATVNPAAITAAKIGSKSMLIKKLNNCRP